MTKPLLIGAYAIHLEGGRYPYVVRRQGKPNIGRCFPSMALAIHHARRLNRLYPKRKSPS